MTQSPEVQALIDQATAGVVPPRPRGLAETLESVEALFTKYVRFPDEHGPVALALFVAVTHAIDSFDVAPYVNISSPEKRSGKSRIQEVAEQVVRNPLRVGSASPAYVYRMMAGATLLLDEADKVFAGKDENSAALTGALNDGWRRGSGAGRVDKTSGGVQTPVKFDAFGCKMFAGIGRKVPDTIQDRSIPLFLQRKAPGESVARLRYRKLPLETFPISEALAKWAAGAQEALSEAEPDLPDELHDRAQDIWEPLLALADMADGDWPKRARAAAVGLHGASFEDDSFGVRLLRDVRTIFDATKEKNLASAGLVSSLNDIEESPWGGWPMDARKLARDLKPFTKPDGSPIKPGTVRLEDGRTAKGYAREWFEDAWARYLDAPLTPPSQASQASQAAKPQPARLSDVTAVTAVTDTPREESLDAEVVVECLREHGPQSVPALAGRLGVAWTVVARVLQELEAEGRVWAYVDDEQGVEVYDLLEVG